MNPTLKMYSDLAPWWSLLSRPEDYAEEAAFYHATLLAAGIPDGSRLLELGSGGGSNASHLKAHYRMTLVDLSPAILAVSQALNPELEHLQGDMRNVRLERQFNAVFIHDAISYMTSEDDLSQALATAYAHCRPAGVALFHPDHTRENFRPATDHGGHDGPDRAMRYLEWFSDPDPSDSTYSCDFAYLLHLPDGSLRGEHERHIFGLFATHTWLDLIRRAGFEPQAIPFVHSELPPGSSTLFLGRKKEETKTRKPPAVSHHPG